MKSLILILYVLIISSCSKPPKTNCRYYYTDIAADIALVTNNVLDFDTLIVNKYKSNDSFNILLASDTIFNVYAMKSSDGYRLRDDKAQIYEGVDMEFVFPNITKTYKINTVFYGTTNYFDVLEDGCLNRTFLRGPETVKLNGAIFKVGKDEFSDPVIFLSK